MVPAKLKANCLYLIEDVLHGLNITEGISISMASYLQEDHIPTKILLDSANNLPDLSCNLVSTEKSIRQILGSTILISNNGDTYLITDMDDYNVTLIHYDMSRNPSKKTIYTKKTIIKKLNLADQTVVFTKDNQKNQSTWEKSYVLNNCLTFKADAVKMILISLAITIVNLAIPLGFQTFTDKILPYNALGSLYVISILLVFAAICSSSLQYTHDYLESVLLGKTRIKLGKEVHNRLFNMDIYYFDKSKTGDLTKLVEQVRETTNFLIKQLLSSIVSIVSLLIIMPVLFFYNSNLALLVLLIGCTMAFTAWVSLKFLKKRIENAYLYDAIFQTTTIEIFKGIRTIKSLSNEPYFLQKANATLENNLFGEFSVTKIITAIRSTLNFQSQLITVAIIFFGAHAVFNNTMTIGQLIAFNMLAGNLVNPLLSLVMTASGWENFKLARNKLEELKPNNQETLLLTKEPLNLNGKIEFSDVWFKYPSHNSTHDQVEEGYALRGIHITIEPGEIIGIVGGSGSGKSTLANLLLGFYQPTRGNIYLNSYDIEQIPTNVLRSRISSVQQTSFLFNTSILENVHLGRLNSNVSDIQAALEASGSSNFVEDLPLKHLTHLSEDGGNLSGGQRQRLAIARALVRNSDILLFDEATSALDNQTEEKIKETIYQACQNKTGIIIAHRLNTLSYCDRIVVMQHGQIEAVGTHDELLAGDNSYKVMWDATMKRDAAMDRLSLHTDALPEKPDQEVSDAV